MHREITAKSVILAPKFSNFVCRDKCLSFMQWNSSWHFLEKHNTIVDDELHIFKDCSLCQYEGIRSSLDPATQENIASEDLNPLFNEVNIKNLANYVNHIF